MAKYKVRMTRLQYGEVEVEAESPEQAEFLASGKEVDWFDEEITDMTTEEVLE